MSTSYLRPFALLVAVFPACLLSLAQGTRIDTLDLDTIGNKLSIRWTPDMSALQRVESSKDILSGWTNVSDWAIAPLTPSMFWSVTALTNTPCRFYRIVSRSEPVTYLTDGIGNTNLVIYIRNDVSNGVVRSLYAFGDTDSNGVADVAHRDDILRTSSNSYVWLQSYCTDTATGRYVTATCVSDCSSGNWSASYASSAADAFPILGSGVSTNGLCMIATNNFPFVETVGTTSVYVRFPKTAVSNAASIQFDGNIQVVDEDPLIVWHFDNLIYGMFSHFGLKCSADVAGVHMSWSNPLNFGYKSRDNDNEQPFYRPKRVYRQDFIYHREDKPFIWHMFKNEKYDNSVSLPTDALQCDMPLDPGRYRVGIFTMLETTSGKELWVLDRDIEVEVPSPNPVIAISPTSIALSIIQGQTPASQSFEVWNSGQGTLHYSMSDDANWMAVSPTSGQSAGVHNTSTISFSGVETLAASAQPYVGHITVTDTDYNTTTNLTVGLTVNPRTDGLVAYYPCDGNAIDVSGNGMNGAMQGTTSATDRTGAVGKALHFDGSARVNLPTSVLGSWNALTYSCWVKAAYHAPANGLYGFISSVHDGNGSRNTSIGVFYDDNGIYDKLYYEIDTGSENQWLRTGGSLPWGQWTHVAMVYDGSTITEYVNGNPGLSYLANGTITPASAMYLGCIADYATWTYLVGDLDEVRIYNRALSQVEINGLMQ